MNENFLETVKSEEPTQVDVYIEMDEMWSFCHDKSHQIWLWWAVDHKTNTPLAYIFGTREYKYLDELLKLLSEFIHPTNLLQEREIRNKLKEII